LPLFPKAHYYFVKPNIPRGLQLQQKQTFDLKGEVYNSVSEAYNQPLKLQNPTHLRWRQHLVVAEIL
jgi:dihydrofolate synthase/folylpolyglutamate synthase